MEERSFFFLHKDHQRLCWNSKQEEQHRIHSVPILERPLQAPQQITANSALNLLVNAAMQMSPETWKVKTGSAFDHTPM